MGSCADALLYRAKARIALEQFEEAERDLQTVLRLAPDNKQMERNVKRMLAQARKPDPREVELAKRMVCGTLDGQDAVAHASASQEDHLSGGADVAIADNDANNATKRLVT